MGVFAARSTDSISIHAPSREGLDVACLHRTSHSISIHAPSRERHLAIVSLPASIPFQSTLPRGSDKDLGLSDDGLP